MNCIDRIDRRIEETLSSLDNMKRASPGPFFFIRLQIGLVNKKPDSWKRMDHLLSRPWIAFLLIIIVVMINGVAIRFAAGNSVPTVNKTEHYFSTEYDIATSGFYNIENTDLNENQ